MNKVACLMEKLDDMGAAKAWEVGKGLPEIRQDIRTIVHPVGPIVKVFHPLRLTSGKRQSWKTTFELGGARLFLEADGQALPMLSAATLPQEGVMEPESWRSVVANIRQIGGTERCYAFVDPLGVWALDCEMVPGLLDIPEVKMWGAIGPRLVWSTDGSWMAGLHQESHFTALSGRRELIDAILNDSRIEAYEVPVDCGVVLDPPRRTFV